MDTEAIAGEDSARPVGAALAAARAARGLSLADVARETRVPLRHLAAIEADDHDNLPALPYAIGFVKAFARVVGVDPDAAGARFRAETSKAAHVPLPSSMTPLDESRLPPRGVVGFSIVGLLVVVGIVVAWSAGMFDRAPSGAPGAPDASRSAGVAVPGPASPPLAAVTPPGPASGATAAPGAGVAPAAASGAMPGSPTPDTGTPSQMAPPAAAGGAVTITANEDAWLKLSAYSPGAGKVVTIKTGVLARGERYVVPPTPGVRLWTGRAGALAITVDGRPIPPLGGPVETVKNVSLDPAALRARLAGPPPVHAMQPGR